MKKVRAQLELHLNNHAMSSKTWLRLPCNFAKQKKTHENERGSESQFTVLWMHLVNCTWPFVHAKWTMRARSRYHSRLQRNFSLDIAKTDEKEANKKNGLHFMVCRYVWMVSSSHSASKTENVAPLSRNLCHWKNKVLKHQLAPLASPPECAISFHPCFAKNCTANRVFDECTFCTTVFCHRIQMCRKWIVHGHWCWA